MPSPLEDRVRAIEARNAKVEAHKAWETSLARRGFLAGVTWLAATLTLAVLEVERPFLPALVPVIGYVISTLSLPYLRRFWIRRFHDKNS